MVKQVVKLLLNKTIYPTNEEYREMTEEYLSEEHDEFFKKFKKDKWIAYYESTFYPNVSLRLLYRNIYCNF